MKKIRISKKKGILFWITGFPGSGKTAIANKIKSEIIKSYGPTIVISGDNLRKIFNYVKDGITEWIHQWKKKNWKTTGKKQVKNKK